MELSRIEIITGMSKFNGLKSALSKAGVRGMTVTQVLDAVLRKALRNMKWMKTMRWSCFQSSRLRWL